MGFDVGKPNLMGGYIIGQTLNDEANLSKSNITDKESSNDEERNQLKSTEQNPECSVLAVAVLEAQSRESTPEGSQISCQCTESGTALSSGATQVQQNLPAGPQNMQQLNLRDRNIIVRGKSKSLHSKPTRMKLGKYKLKRKCHSERRPTKDQQIAAKVFLHLRQSLTAVPEWRFIFRDLFCRAFLTNIIDGLIKEIEDKHRGNIQEQIYELLVRWNQRVQAPWTDKLKMVVETLNENKVYDLAEEIKQLVKDLEADINTLPWTGDAEEEKTKGRQFLSRSIPGSPFQREIVAYPIHGASYRLSITDVQTTSPEICTAPCQVESSYPEITGVEQGEMQITPHSVQVMHLATPELQGCLPATSVSQPQDVTRKRKSPIKLKSPSSRRGRYDEDTSMLQSSSSENSFSSDEEIIREHFVRRKVKKALRRRLFVRDKRHTDACQTPDTRRQFTGGTMTYDSRIVVCEPLDTTSHCTTGTMTDDCDQGNRLTPEASKKRNTLNTVSTAKSCFTSGTRRETSSAVFEEKEMHDKSGDDCKNREPASPIAKILNDLSKELHCSIDDVMTLRATDITDAKQMTGRNEKIAYLIDISTCSADIPFGIISEATWEKIMRLITDRQSRPEDETMQHAQKVPEGSLLMDVLKSEMHVTEPDKLQETASTPGFVPSRSHRRRHFSAGAADVILKHFSQYIYEKQRITQDEVRKRLSESKSLRQSLSIKNPESNDVEVKKEIKKITDRIWTFIKKERKEIPMLVE